MNGLLCCDLSLPTIEENLACDEALLDWCESQDQAEILRLWEPSEFSVVLGYANRAATETNLDYCVANGIRVRRRCSGGGTVLQGPGCLNYAVVLRIEPGTPLETIHGTNTFVMERHRMTLERLLGKPVELCGHTDLALGGLKFSGNAQRRKRRCLIFHGTFLLSLDLAYVEGALRMPSKQPDYRRGRGHLRFITNLGLDRSAVKAALRQCWGAGEDLKTLPAVKIQELVRTKYSLPEWNLKF